MRVMELRHVEADHRFFAAEERSSERPCQFGFADTRWPEKQEYADRTLRIVESRARRLDRIRHRLHGVVLPDHAHQHLVFKMGEALAFVACQIGQRNPCPFAQDVRDIIRADFIDAAADILRITRADTRRAASSSDRALYRRRRSVNSTTS